MILLTFDEIRNEIFKVYRRSDEELDCVGEIIAQTQLRKALTDLEKYWGCVHENKVGERFMEVYVPIADWQSFKAEAGLKE